MTGHPRIIAYLQRAVSHEFTAAQQYTLQAGSAENWGMGDLATKLRRDAGEELEHAEAFIKQMLRLGAEPRSSQPRTPRVGRSHVELLRFGLATEQDAIRLYDEAARFCEQIGDSDNYLLFTRILKDEEDHAAGLQQSLAALGA